ncbi:DUF397 domain-containing protein [Actinomadura fulvescens]|uniref:DUF397 domain-containing protein n=1 Tax=Actinomadura fulvescens TaxID=46160 RepID=UPI0031D8F6D3
MEQRKPSTTPWRKSTHSGGSGGQCVEVADLALVHGWRKSSRSAHQGGECVEVAELRAGVGVRDSKAPDGGHLALSVAAFGELVARVKRSELDL